MATFRTTRYPALVFVTASGQRHKFVGGRLTVDGDAVAEVAAFADARPQYAITREDEAPEPAKQLSVKETLEAVGDDHEKAAEALAAEQARGENARKTLVAELEAIIAAKPQTPEEVQAVLDEALEKGILEEPMTASDTVSAKIDGDKLVLTFADGETIEVPEE